MNKFSRIGLSCITLLGVMAHRPLPLAAQDAGSVGTLRVQVLDADWEAPLAEAAVVLVELDQKRQAGADGSVIFESVPFGNYNIMATKSGFERLLMRGVIVNPGAVQQVVLRLAPVYTDMDELVVRDFDISAGSDTALIELKMSSAATFDAVSADTISRAGAGDAAAALKLVSGATVQDGKYAVVRGLPDRYVNSQLNGVRLPSADADKRAVQLDQFPSAMIESIRVTKTFMPDQQGDATGGAIDIRLKRIPDKFIAKASVGTAYNDQVTGNDLLVSRSGGLSYWGDDHGDRARPFRVGQVDYPQNSNISPFVWNRRMTEEQRQAHLASWQLNADQTDAFSNNYSTRFKKADPGTSWSGTLGEVVDLAEDVRFGFLGTFSYKSESSGYNDGTLNKYIVRNNGTEENNCFDFEPSGRGTRPAFYRVWEGEESILWGGALTTGFESPWINLGLTYLRSQATEESATMIEDRTQLEESSQMWRQQSIHYSERTTETTLFQVEHPWFFLPEEMDVSGGRDWFVFTPPVTDWSISRNKASQYEPDRTIFSEVYNNGQWTGPSGGLSPLERKWRDIEESGWQYSLNQKVPFRIWSGDEGYFKGGYFDDQVERSYFQDTFKYAPGNIGQGYPGDPDDMWSQDFETGYPVVGPPGELQQGWHVVPGDGDIDYRGNQDIQAWYWMTDMQVCSFLSFQGGVRVESTEITSRMRPSQGDYDGNFAVLTLQEKENGSMYVDKLKVTSDEELNEYAPELSRNDRLPALGMTVKPVKNFNLRFNWSQTVARPTFKELMPVEFKESAASDTYFGNPKLEMSDIDNYDLRAECMPAPGQLLSVSYFYKELKNPIDVRSFGGYIEGERFITPVNYPEGEISGFEFEARQDIGVWWEQAKGLTLGFNSTLMDSEVTRTKDEYEQVRQFGGDLTRRMAGQPDYIIGTYAMYDIEDWGTGFGLFFNRSGDVLAVGDGVDGDEYTPCIYLKPLEQLDFTFSQKIYERWSLGFKIKNLLNPRVESEYRMENNQSVERSSYRVGREYSISLACEW